MGIEVVLQDEKCIAASSIVHDFEGVIAASLPDENDAAYCCVRFIDPYGDTIFNRHQARVMLQEWDGIKNSFVERNAEKLWADVREMIVQCSEELHLYLRFIGD